MPDPEVDKKANAKVPVEGTLSVFAGSILANARCPAFVAAIFLYFAGFTYRYMYRETWGITSPDDGTPFYNYLVYSVFPISSAWLPIAGILVVTVATAFFYDRARMKWGNLPNLRPLIAALAVIGLFIVLDGASRSSAVAAFDPIRRGLLPGAHLHFADEKKARSAYGADFMRDNDSSADGGEAQGALTIVEETADM